ncbi:MAG TPA: HNH endonuclease [Candidatus Eisenbacteria bacterium]|nr:HNH endonuclease [Candidatus Eisenbacteria bacterium]
MKSYTHLSDERLLVVLDDLDAQDRVNTAELLAVIGEVDARKLYLPIGYPSMFAYCVGARHYSEDMAYKRIRAARASRRFPAILRAVADGRLHLSGIVLLAPHLTQSIAEELLAEAERRSKREVERLLAARFPRPDLPTVFVPLSAPPQVTQLAPGPVGTIDSPSMEPLVRSDSAFPPARTEVPRAQVTPLAPGRSGLQTTIRQETQDLMQEVQDLMGADVATDDLDAVLYYSFQAAKEKLLKRKCAATDRPRPGRQRSADSRNVPAEVRRAVWERDGGQCTFTSDTGHRCTERKDVQFDHIDPYARDGASSVSNIRLLCRAHNQYEAERTYGAEFMRQKRKA